MLTLAVECSAGPASAAVVEDGRVLGESFVHIRQTHSQTLLPMVEQLLAVLGKSISEMDLLAVSHGPGSFTGVRIGVSCVKGMALPGNTPCCGLSTLEVIAQGGIGCEGAVLCPVMDARVQQVYQALFTVKDGALLRLCEDRALSIQALAEEVSSYGDKLLLLGDGAELCYQSFREWGARLAPPQIRYQRASSVGLLAEVKARKGETVSPAALAPAYLRVPQAVRELKRKQEGSV